MGKGHALALADYVRVKPVIDTERLCLRPLVEGDVEALREWMPDASIYAFWGKGPGKTDRDPSLLFARAPRPTKSFHLGIEDWASGKVVGELWVHKIEGNRMASVAIRLAAACQRRGYGTEALSAMVRFCFDRTELRRLQAEVDVRNVASQRMLETCGFTREGLIRQGKMVSTWCDYYIYGILSTDAVRE